MINKEYRIDNVAEQQAQMVNSLTAYLMSVSLACIHSNFPMKTLTKHYRIRQKLAFKLSFSDFM